MSQGTINFEEIKKETGILLGSAEEAEVGAKQLQTLMDGLCEKNDAPAIKRAVDGMLETVNAFIKTIRDEMEIVQDMTAKTEKLAAASGYQ